VPGPVSDLSPKNRIRIEVDRELCYGFADCVDTTPKVFALDDEDVAIVLDADGAAVDDILTASQNCPVDAIFVFDESGDQLAP
jgi:ferredoxin